MYVHIYSVFIYWAVMPCELEPATQAWRLRNYVLRNVGIYVEFDTALQPRRSMTSFSLP
jgi:hypothetical protein